MQDNYIMWTQTQHNNFRPDQIYLLNNNNKALLSGNLHQLETMWIKMEY